MSSDDVVESLSVEETNAIRIKLGLKPLHSEPDTSNNTVKYSADTEVTYVTPVIESKKAIELENRLNERLNHKARAKLIDGPTLAESLNDDPLDPLVWAQRQRNKQKLNSKQNLLIYSDDEASPQDDNHTQPTPQLDQANLKVVHDYNNLDSNSVLTLCDTSILEAQDEGVDDIDYLQSTDLAEKEKIDKNNSIKKDKPMSYEDYVSKAMDDTSDKNILEKYDDFIQENSGSSFTNFIKGFFISNKTQSKVDATNDTEIVIGKPSPLDDNNNNKIIKKSIPKISKRSRVPNWDELFNDSEPKPVSIQPSNEVNKPIIKPRMVSNQDTTNDDIDDKLYQQLTKQRRVARTAQAQLNNKVKLENIKQDQYEVKYEITQVDEFCKYVDPVTKINNNNDCKNNNKTRLLEPATQDFTTTTQPDNPLEEQPLDCGIANTLKYLKTKGQLEPVKFEKDDIKLNYVNKFGKTMTPKEAFKELCYSFHGKMPGKNKQEKRLRKLEMELRLLQNPSNSLPTMRALLQNQKSDKCPHIVLDGTNK